MSGEPMKLELINEPLNRFVTISVSRDREGPLATITLEGKINLGSRYAVYKTAKGMNDTCERIKTFLQKKLSESGFSISHDTSEEQPRSFLYSASVHVGQQTDEALRRIFGAIVEEVKRNPHLFGHYGVTSDGPAGTLFRDF